MNRPLKLNERESFWKEKNVYDMVYKIIIAIMSICLYSCNKGVDFKAGKSYSITKVDTTASDTYDSLLKATIGAEKYDSLKKNLQTLGNEFKVTSDHKIGPIIKDSILIKKN